MRGIDVTGTALASAAVRSSVWMASGRAIVQMACGFALVLFALVAPAGLADGRLSAPMLALVAFLPLGLAEVLDPSGRRGLPRGAHRSVAAPPAAILRDTPPAVQDPAHPLSLPLPLVGSTEALRVCQVSATWGARTVLHDLSLDLPPGSRLAVVGPTGSGKSTLAGLLVRFIDPASGVVRLAGTDVRELALDDVRRTVGLVDDDPHIFGSTLAENIRLARPAATDADIESALRGARLGEWLDTLPDGLGSWLGAGAAGVSGGERARIGLARVLLSDNPVVVLDEPTAHLDAATALAVTADLLSGVGTRSVVMTTHRPEGLDLVDVVLDLSAPEPRDAELGELLGAP